MGVVLIKLGIAQKSTDPNLSEKQQPAVEKFFNILI